MISKSTELKLTVAIKDSVDLSSSDCPRRPRRPGFVHAVSQFEPKLGEMQERCLLVQEVQSQSHCHHILLPCIR